ncbi:MAG: hypothetical protein ACREQ5_22735 [Candidatus Dormibacteria bacterium]
MQLRTPRIRNSLTALVALAFVVLPLARPALAASAIASGTTINGVLETALDSSNAQVGDGVTIALTSPYPNDDSSYAGALVRGHVSNVVRAGQGRKAEIDIAFDSIVLADGATAPLNGHVVSVGTQHKSAVLQQAAGAGIGMIVGNILGKKLGTNLGGLAGAAGGFLYANNLRTNVTLPKGANIQIQTDRTVPRPQAAY